MTGYIYLFRDSGYDVGVKIGYDATNKCASAWKAAPSYSPRAMIFGAAWEIPAKLVDSSKSPGENRRYVEQELHLACGRLMSDMPEYPRTGRDWVWTDQQAALKAISNVLGCRPHIVDGHLGKKVSNDNFRNPRPDKVAANRFKIVAWLYRELQTGRLKTQFIDDWTSPREKRRRYSRNGIEELAAFTYPGATTSSGNIRVLEARSKVVRTFGQGPEDQWYGWLNEGVTYEDVASAYSKLLDQIDPRATRPPEGVRGAYNLSE